MPMLSASEDNDFDDSLPPVASAGRCQCFEQVGIEIQYSIEKKKLIDMQYETRNCLKVYLKPS